MSLRLAIVGFGPKGLFALERLLDQAGPDSRLDIDLYDPHPALGAGPVYDPAQPPYLRMNLAADRVDAWRPGSRAIPAGEQVGFCDWSGAGDGQYPPRAEVGRYLQDCFARMRAHAPAGVLITPHRRAVTSARPRDAAWLLAAGNELLGSYDEVLMAVGHGAGPEHHPRRQMPGEAVIPAVFPVQHWLGPAAVVPGAAVAVRGFALTFLDAALALTEGRGGTFRRTGHPYRLVYSPAPGQAGVIRPFSRSGRPMAAKPPEALADSMPGLASAMDSASRRLRELEGTVELEADLLPLLESAATAALAAAGALSGDVGAMLASACEGPVAEPAADPAEDLTRSLDVGAGLRLPGSEWALGHVWQRVYPVLVDKLSGTGLADRDWPAFRRLAVEMERLAFGPPAVNAAKLLALIESGVVNLRHVAGGVVSSDDHGRSFLGGDRVDVVIDAVLPGPGLVDSHGGLLEQLRLDGLVQIAPGRRGIAIDTEGSCIDPRGGVVGGLACAGRPTEDWVIGNDTLSRSLHPQLEGWARRVAERAARLDVPAVAA